MKFAPLCLLLLASFFTHAQNVGIKDSSKTTPVVKREKLPKALCVTLSFFNHSISPPFHKMISKPLHPGVQAGIEGRYFETVRTKIFQTLNLGMFYNNYNGKSFYINTELAYRYTSNPRIFAETLVGIGFLRTYHPTDIYQLNSLGVYEEVKDKGFSSPIISFAIGIGYSIKSSSSFSFAPFIRYESLIQTKYNSELGVLPHTAFHIGIRVNKKRAK